MWFYFVLLALMLLVHNAAAWGLGDGPSKKPLLTTRRQWVAGLSVAGCSLVANSPSCEARDELFQTNPLTNPLFEQIRIWDQALANQIKYDGELAPGDAGNRGNVEGYPRLLVPILKIDSDLSLVNAGVGNREEWLKVQEIISAPTFDKISLKKTFNAFSDNIYYSDPDRANWYLGGGAAPRNEQSLAYLQRNEIITNVEALRAEIDFLLKDSTGEEPADDLVVYAKKAAKAMAQYLELVPPSQMKIARELLNGIS